MRKGNAGTSRAMLVGRGTSKAHWCMLKAVHEYSELEQRILSLYAGDKNAARCVADHSGAPISRPEEAVDLLQAGIGGYYSYRDAGDHALLPVRGHAGAASGYANTPAGAESPTGRAGRGPEYQHLPYRPAGGNSG